jgi:hypothetical protein
LYISSRLLDKAKHLNYEQGNELFFCSDSWPRLYDQQNTLAFWRVGAAETGSQGKHLDHKRLPGDEAE